MSNEGRRCPECQTGSKPRLAVGPGRQFEGRRPEANLPAAGAVFNYVDFWVCPKCGRTFLYADHRASAKAGGKELRAAVAGWDFHEERHRMSIENAIASLAVKDLAAAGAWYEALIGRAADSKPMPEVAEWKFPRGGWLQVYQLPELGPVPAHLR